MVSITTAILACVGGLMAYVAIPIVAMTAPVELRKKVGTFYLKLGARSLKQFTFVRRVLSGYDILPISVDDEQKLLEVTLSGSTLGEDNQYRFADPDNRIGHLFNKPVALAYEEVPAAVDAELAEWGHWVREKAERDGLLADGGKIDPYVQADDGLRLIDPLDFYSVVSNDIDSENIRTAEKKTKQRFQKYNDGVSLEQTLRVLIGFAAGVGGVMCLHYVNNELVSGGGGGPPGSDIIGSPTIQLALDLGVALV